MSFSFNNPATTTATTQQNNSLLGSTLSSGTTNQPGLFSSTNSATAQSNPFISSGAKPASGFNLNFGSTQPPAMSFSLGSTGSTQQNPSALGSSLFGATTNQPGSSLLSTNTQPSNLTTTNAAKPASGFNLNFGSTQQPAISFSSGTPATTTATTQQNTSTLGSSLFSTSTNQPSSSLLGTSGQTSGQASNLTTNAAKPTSGFNLNFGSTQPAATSQTAATNSTLTTNTSSSSALAPSSAITTNASQFSSGLTASTATTTATAPTSGQQVAAQTAAQPTQMTFKQLEGYINVWLNELNQMEADFQKQSQTINSWDSLLVNNALKITNLNETLDLLKEEHKRIDQQLDFVISQQNELEQLLEPLEKIQVDFNINDTASTEREFTYSLVDTVSNDLQGIGTELQNFIKKLNETKANQDLNDPLSSIGKILNSHVDALQYIEHQIGVLKRNVEA